MFRHDSQLARPQADAEWLPPGTIGTLDEFALNSEGERGVMVDSLEAGATLVVGTKHSCYRFVVIDPERQLARVTGGTLFPEPTEVRIEGSTIGGSMLKAGWVGVDLRLEFIAGVRRITTSRVKFLTIEETPSEASAA